MCVLKIPVTALYSCVIFLVVLLVGCTSNKQEFADFNYSSMSGRNRIKQTANKSYVEVEKNDSTIDLRLIRRGCEPEIEIQHWSKAPTYWYSVREDISPEVSDNLKEDRVGVRKVMYSYNDTIVSYTTSFPSLPSRGDITLSKLPYCDSFTVFAVTCHDNTIKINIPHYIKPLIRYSSDSIKQWLAKFDYTLFNKSLKNDTLRIDIIQNSLHELTHKVEYYKLFDTNSLFVDYESRNYIKHTKLIDSKYIQKRQKGDAM